MKQKLTKKQNDEGVSRRALLQRGAAAAVAGGVTTLLGANAGTASAAASQASTSVTSQNVAGRTFRAWVQHRGGPGKGSAEELKLLPISDRQVVVRTEATQCCYSITARVLGTADPYQSAGPVLPGQAVIHGHGGVGIVEAIGPAVRGLKVGNRVIVGVTPQCGVCYNCVNGRADHWAFCRYSKRGGSAVLAVMSARVAFIKSVTSLFPLPHGRTAVGLTTVANMGEPT
jgi:S-(hydroxymethyl)glutathione dehydrogenase/alcohol dehydrogenase